LEASDFATFLATKAIKVACYMGGFFGRRVFARCFEALLRLPMQSLKALCGRLYLLLARGRKALYGLLESF
jgi:hypothetical protein